MDRERITTAEKRKRLMVMLAEVRRLADEVLREEAVCEHKFIDSATSQTCLFCGKVLSK